MATIEQVVQTRGAPDAILLSGVSWDLYERLRDIEDNENVRMTFCRGQLEMMSPSGKHEELRKMAGRLLEALTEELDIPLRSLGATTWKRKKQEFALEADECYYIKNEPTIRAIPEIDGSSAPPPDLAIEIEVSRKAISKMPLYAMLGVAEVWRFDGARLQAFRLTPDGKYAQCERSVNLPFLNVADLSEFLQPHHDVGETTWIRSFRGWGRQTFGGKQGG